MKHQTDFATRIAHIEKRADSGMSHFVADDDGIVNIRRRKDSHGVGGMGRFLLTMLVLIGVAGGGFYTWLEFCLHDFDTLDLANRIRQIISAAES